MPLRALASERPLGGPAEVVLIERLGLMEFRLSHHFVLFVGYLLINNSCGFLKHQVGFLAQLRYFLSHSCRISRVGILLVLLVGEGE